MRAFYGALLLFLYVVTLAHCENATDCGRFSGSTDNENCGNCVRNPACMYCYSDHKCKPYPVGHILPSASDCPLADARWGTCFVNFLALIICMSVIAFVLLVVLPCCVYCCCCRGKSGPSRRTLAENARYDQDRGEREARHAENRSEREKKYDEIRAKYGLTSHGAPATSSASGYREFSNPA